MNDQAKLKILAISFCYNEINFIKLKYDWCKSQDIDLYIIDNISDDGTYEYLMENKIPNHRFNTGGEFHLEKLQKELIKTINILKPDWVIYMGVDEFFFSKHGLRKDIEEANKKGYDLIKVKALNMKNTGELNNSHIFNKFFYFDIPVDYDQGRIVKYHDNLTLLADHFENNNKNKIMQHSDSFFLLNYGDTKTAKERMSTLERRRKAWDNGLKRAWGKHYINGGNQNWTWDKNKLQDIRTSTYNWVIKDIQYLSNTDVQLNEKIAKPFATIAMPLYDMGEIAILALEGLCNQATKYKWELIICEEDSDKKLGQDNIERYRKRLEKAGCINIKYISIKEWIPLGQKWKMIADSADNTICLLLQAGDCFSHSKRIECTCEQFATSKIDYYDEQQGYFYSFRLNKTIIFNPIKGRGADHPCRLNMAWSTKIFKMLPDNDTKMNVDSFLFNTLSDKKPKLLKHRNMNLYKDGVDTDGYNKISSRDKFFMEKNDIFQFTEFDAFVEIPIIQDFKNKTLTQKRFKDKDNRVTNPVVRKNRLEQLRENNSTNKGVSKVKDQSVNTVKKPNTYAQTPSKTDFKTRGTDIIKPPKTQPGPTLEKKDEAILKQDSENKISAKKTEAAKRLSDARNKQKNKSIIRKDFIIKKR